MRIALLSGANSIHTIQWANSLCSAGHEVHVISQHAAAAPFAPPVRLHLFPFRGVVGYFLITPAVRKLLKEIKPDIVNAHYASGYGTTARLSGYSPWVLSVWGSDVYKFPYQSPLHKWLVKKNLSAADAVASTSVCMAHQTRKLCPSLNNLAITPFGVDLSAYKEASIAQSLPINPGIVIGTVKTMAPQYGIDTLIESFAMLLNQLFHEDPSTASILQLRLVGGGPQTEELKALAYKLGVAGRVKFIGSVPHHMVPQELARLDIYVALSRQESFGVAIIEAGAAGKPVVVSDAGGLPEVVVDNVTGYVVPRNNPQAAADAIRTLVYNPDLRRTMGTAGKTHVERLYSWPACVQQMVNFYQDIVKSVNNKQIKQSPA